MILQLRIGSRLRSEIGADVVDFTDLQQALLLLLADAGASGMSRNHAAEMLWVPEEGATSPRRRLRQLIYAVNRRSNASTIVGDVNSVRLGPAVTLIWTGEDAGAEIVAPTKAFAVVRQEISDRGWTRSREDVLSSVDQARLADNPERILELVTSDSNPDSLWRDGVWALLRSGRVREAEAVFARLGVSDPGTLERCRAALGRLLSGEIPGPESDRIDAPLIGRADVVAEAIRALRSDDRRIVLSGPSGVGLTRTLGSVTAWILSEMDDLVVASATCSYSGRSIAYDTLNRLFDSELFRAAHLEVEEPWRSVIARVLRVYDRAPEVDIEPLEGTAASLRVLHGISHLILKAIGTAQLVAVVDDLHLADPASLTVLTHLGVDGEGAVIRLLGAVRTDGPVGGPVQQLLERDATVVEVEPLAPADARELVAALRPDLGEEIIDTVATLADGYPRRILEASRAIETEAAELCGTTLDDLLRARLDGLNRAEQKVLALLSVVPDGIGAQLLMNVSELGLLDLGRALETLKSRGVVESDPTVRIRSSFLRRQIRTGLPSAIQSALHRSIAAELQRIEPVQSSDVGRHLSEAGDHTEAVDWLIRGAREAADAEAFPVAIDLMTRAIEGVGADAIGWQNLEFAGGLCVAEGRFAEASDLFGASVLAGEASDVDEKRLLGVRLKLVTALAECRFGDDRPLAQAWALLAKARELEDLDAEARALDALFRIADFNLDFDLTWATLEELKQARDRDEVSPYLDWVEVRRAYIDNPEAARAAAFRFYEFSEPESSERLMALSRMVSQGSLRGGPGDEDVTSAMSELSTMSGVANPFHCAETISNAATWHLERGEFDLASSQLTQALELMRAQSNALFTSIYANFTEVALCRGDLDQAKRYLAALKMAESDEPSARNRLIADHLDAWIALESGALRRAIELVGTWSEIPLDGPISSYSHCVIRPALRVQSLSGGPEKQRTMNRLESRAERLGFARMLDDLRALGRAAKP